MEPDLLYNAAGLVQFYDLENGPGPDDAFCLRMARDAASILDLGCGTGRLAAAMGKGRRVVGVDPAAAMLEVARDRPGGSAVAWVEADARDVRLGERFDFVVLTGHAFQVFLTDGDRGAVLRTIAAHLTPGGRFVFDTRNPLREEWREWTPVESMRRLDHPQFGVVEAWNDVAFDEETDVVTYETHYKAGGKTLSAASRIGFVGRDRLAALIGEAGLAVDRWLGDWSGAPCLATSPEIIPVGRLA